MILLTDEEIQEATTFKGSLPAPSWNPYDEVARAQLKKVVEWLVENDLLRHSPLHYDSTYAGTVEGCEACVLLEEVK